MSRASIRHLWELRSIIISYAEYMGGADGDELTMTKFSSSHHDSGIPETSSCAFMVNNGGHLYLQSGSQGRWVGKCTSNMKGCKSEIYEIYIFKKEYCYEKTKQRWRKVCCACSSPPSSPALSINRKTDRLGTVLYWRTYVSTTHEFAHVEREGGIKWDEAWALRCL